VGDALVAAPLGSSAIAAVATASIAAIVSIPILIVINLYSIRTSKKPTRKSFGSRESVCEASQAKQGESRRRRKKIRCSYLEHVDRVSGLR